jgi:hypothetical protein
MTDSFQLPSILLCSSHPQLVQLIESSTVSQDLRRRFVQKKERSRGALNFLTLGGARSSTLSLHHPGQGASRLTARQLGTVRDVFQGESLHSWLQTKQYFCSRNGERYLHDQAYHHDLFQCLKREPREAAR